MAPSRRFPCNWPECSYIATSSIGLERHVRTHTGEKPFNCKYQCGYSASLDSNLKRHEKSHENNKNHMKSMVKVLMDFSRQAQEREDLTPNSPRKKHYPLWKNGPNGCS